jgi:hypothetical protein
MVDLGSRDEDLVVVEVVQAARVIGVEMGHDDATDIGRQDPKLLELRAISCSGSPRSRTANREKRLPTREFARLRNTGRLAGIDDDHALRMLDGKGVDGSGSVHSRSRSVFTSRRRPCPTLSRHFVVTATVPV